ncbi:hypothetical protein DMN91_007783 [Ooceraea biroi]|uniref:Alpha-tocopherol transfer protein-like protein n=1 Tax=Ooceraea biroi TaxID=2015173 RepID=A0A026WT78_OOCBI|nr:alpha-tocopherol transfer protein-like [Ooceraea biroi]XP_011330891.1 alpha-tocopherol transfer protein-like [Ooceraea biroi]XP_011330892.1 alpha-tocopherol transfer protein-like [Ooceraea biroi]XP_011330893.1 alpha-tocopherol transfer protein-like [Ooceraea biroi]EZA59217.1 Alpha-tocopherol transfer protein-like protein [Ooceraea biroi]RLU19226.1 hypothetical protein DMN91_007783 [Ooceraea biroi]
MMSSSSEQEMDPATLITTNHLRKIMTNAAIVTISKHSINIELEDPDEYFIQKAKDELRETPEFIAQGYKELREYIAGEPNLHLPDDEDFLIKFLRPCKWYAKSAFRLIQRHFGFRQTYSHIFVNLLPSHEKVAFCSNLLYPLPIRNKDGSRIILIMGGKKWKPKEVSLDSYFRSLLFLLFVAMTEYKTQISGVQIILDMEGLTLNHITYITPTFAKMLVEFIQRCVPLRVKSIHIINQSFLFNMAFAIFKPFLEEKLRKRIFFHGRNREPLMAHIDKKALFKMYGGELDEPEELFGTNLWQLMCQYDVLFKALLEFGYRTNDNKK